MYIETTNSTNTLLREMVAAGNPPEYIYTGYQSAGRGQSGNGWESEEGKNLLCSILLPPRENLFELNVVTSVAVQRLLGEQFSIKWPNDIYYGDRKIAGILIENAIIGNEIRYSIAGIGLNVNQTEWRSNAPNPVSWKEVDGIERNIDELMERLMEQVQVALNEDVWTYYKAHLYRREGFWPFVEREVSATPTMNADLDTQGQFRAHIADITPQGEIVLIDLQGKKRIYHFKQVRYVV